MVVTLKIDTHISMALKKKILKNICLTFCLISSTSGIAKSNFEYSGEIDISIGYDSNVVVEEVDLSTSLGDNFFRIGLGGEVAYSFNNKAKISFGASLNDRQQRDASAFDLRTILSNIGYVYKIDKTTYSLTYRHANAELAGSDFLTLSQIEPAFSTFLSKKHYIRAAYTYIEKSLALRSERDASSHKGELSYFYFYNGLKQYLILSGQFRDEDANSNELDFIGTRLRAAWIQRYTVANLPQKLTIDLRYRQRDYEQAVDPEINDFRDEQRFSFELSNETSLSDALRANISVRYTDNNSNKLSFDFEETRVQIGLNYSF